MEELILEIIAQLRERESLSAKELAAIIDAANAREGGPERAFAKKRLLPWYFRVKREQPQRWKAWNIDEDTEQRLIATLRMKPRRTASGVATVTVITKPWPCSGDCLFCPSDLRMPKSYLHNEPACQRAERNFFDPYLQVKSRLRTLEDMGHICDKVELIVLGGSWTDYPQGYRLWFIRELFRALNEDDNVDASLTERRAFYEEAGISWESEPNAERVAALQGQVDDGKLRYAQAYGALYGPSTPWGAVSASQEADVDAVLFEHTRNEYVKHRCVGLVVETRPDAVSCETLTELRAMGCTKLQLGIQSLRGEVLRANEREADIDVIAHALKLTRLFGFKSHTHFMTNLYGSDAAADKLDYERFVTDGRFMPDEVKLYPCALIEGTRLCKLYDEGAYRPYDEEELLDVLGFCEQVTPAWTRISRMVRDFSSDDIVAGNKKPSLRQEVERRIRAAGTQPAEIRFRELGCGDVNVESLELEELAYDTSGAREYFLQWVTPQGGIAGFCRLSLPDKDAVEALGEVFPLKQGQAMIRELHVYGRVAGIDAAGDAAQHHGLGRKLVQRAEQIAVEAGYTHLNVISAVGTRPYYRKLGFKDDALYQSKRIGRAQGMDEKTVRTLAALTTSFYETHTESFSATRQRPWKGWTRIAEVCGLSGCETLRIADLACGNLRFERYLADALPDCDLDAHLFDSCDALALPALHHAPGSWSYTRVDLLNDVAFAAKCAAALPHLSPASCDLVVSFGFMHHIPSAANRLRFLRAMLNAVKPGGHVAVSLWQFMDDERLAAKACLCTEEALQAWTSLQLENGDYLLGWKDSTEHLRYCHHFTQKEGDELAASLSEEAELVADFTADGKSGRLNRYLVLKRK